MRQPKSRIRQQDVSGKRDASARRLRSENAAILDDQTVLQHLEFTLDEGDPLATAHGLLNGVAIGLLLWLGIGVTTLLALA